MSERAWQPGPWTAEWWQDEKRPWKNPQVRILNKHDVLIEDAYYCEDDVFNLTAADAALIALAPEMAEAILDWSIGWGPGVRTPQEQDAASNRLDDLAEKLKEIG